MRGTHNRDCSAIAGRCRIARTSVDVAKVKTAMAARALGHVNLPVVWGADEDACDRCHAAPIILIATKIIAATAIMGHVPAPKPRPMMGTSRFIFCPS